MWRAGLVFLAALSGCSSPDWVGPHCLDQLEEALVNASTEERYLGLSLEQQRAVVEVTNAPGPEAPLCSGVFVAPDWVVTAAHCLVIEAPYVVVRGDDASPIAVPIAEAVPHPALDVALLRVEVPEDAGVQIRPIEVAAPEMRSPSPGDAVELAGYGVTETGGTRELGFLVEPIVSAEDESLVVSGFGASGACSGDSGGPLLMRDASGSAVVAGVLSVGSASCVEHDRYVRLDRIAPWLDEWTGGYASESLDCGGITEAGRCFRGTAVFCEAGKLVADDCTLGAVCGWDRALEGFRCVAPALDPCHGVDSVGSCRDGAALRCKSGVLEQQDCDCGRVCGIDGRTGGPRCGG